MGGVCSAGTKPAHANRVGDGDHQISRFSGKLKSINSFSKKTDKTPSHSRTTNNNDNYSGETTSLSNYNSGELLFNFSGELKPSIPARGPTVKDSQKSWSIGKAGAVSLEKAVDVLDTLGSSMSNFNSRSGFVSGFASRGNIISILAFEVANTIAKGANLFRSLSEENVDLLKGEILHSQGVQNLVSRDMNLLLCIAASDKREEFDLFAREIIRFGNLCKDPQWHNLDRYFSKLDTEYSTDKQPREESKMIMLELTTLAKHTSELYRELNDLDRFEQDYQHKLEEMESLNLPRKGESLSVLQNELKQQRKLVRSLKKKSLWSKSLEEVMEKLVDTVIYLHQTIIDAFGTNGADLAGKGPVKNSQRLGPVSLALHYANVIHQIDNIASRPASLPPSARDNLYQALPLYVKTALRSRLHMVGNGEELTVCQVKDEMEKTLHWLVPVASNTTKAHQGFGWVGEWASAGNELEKDSTSENNLIRLQTLYHADKQKTDECILQLVTWLHLLINLSRERDQGVKDKPFATSTRKGGVYHSQMQGLFSFNHYRIQLSQEDRDLLNKVCRRRLVPGISKSQDFFADKTRRKIWALSRSTGSSPLREFDITRRP